MFTLEGLLARRRRDPTAAVAGAAAAVPHGRYTSVDPGIALVPVEEMLQGQEELLYRIRLTYGFEQSRFEADILGVVRRYAQFCHLLPATADNFFADHGGLFRMGLEIGFLALQGTDGFIFAGGATISERARLEPRWRYATFIAGLLSEVHRALSHVIVTGEDGHDWPAYRQPLVQWARERKLQRYFLRWRSSPTETRSLGLFAASQIVPVEAMQYLDADNSTIVAQMLGTIGGLPSHRNPNVIERLVRTCAAVVIQSNLSATASRYGRPIVGAHLERYLVDAMQRLAASGAWEVNKAKSRLWYGTDGLHLVWPNAAADIVRVLERDRVPGIPKSPETIAEILLSAGVLQRHPNGGALFEIAPEGAMQAVTAVRLSSPQILLTSLVEAPPPLNREMALPDRPSSANADRDMQTPRVGAARTDEESDDDEEDDDERQGAEAPGATAAAASPRPDVNGLQGAIGAESAVGAAPARPSLGRERGAEAGDVRAGRQGRFELRAPVHLNPAVRRALAEIVETLNDGATAECCTAPKGLFVPLEQFPRHAVETSVAVSALFEVGMLVGANANARTVQHEFDGQRKLGVYVHPRYVAGLDVTAFSQ